QTPQAQAPATPQTYYQLLQVDPIAHPTVIRYAYRYLAAMYHPDNSESGDAEKFKVITEAWRTLSDSGRRQAYDMQMGVKAHNVQSSAGAAATAPSAAPSYNAPKASLS